MVQMSILSDCLNKLDMAEKMGKRSVLLFPVNKVVIQFLQTMQRHGYVGDFEYNDNERGGAIDVVLKGRLNKVSSVMPAFPVKCAQYESWVTRFLPSRLFGHLVLLTSSGIIDHDEARKLHVGGKILGYFY